jgi:hypothetical protein
MRWLISCLRMVRAGVHVNEPFLDGSGQIALVAAAQLGDTAIVEALLAAPGIKVNGRDKSHETALTVASSLGHHSIVKVLRSPYPCTAGRRSVTSPFSDAFRV